MPKPQVGHRRRRPRPTSIELIRRWRCAISDEEIARGVEQTWASHGQKAIADHETVWGRPGVAMSSTVTVARALIPKSSRCKQAARYCGVSSPPSNVSFLAVCSNGIRWCRGRRGRSKRADLES